MDFTVYGRFLQIKKKANTEADANANITFVTK